MFRRERRQKILDIVRREGHVEVENLARLFGVGVDSIRKDLQHLAKAGKLIRVYGGATRLDDEKDARSSSHAKHALHASTNAAHATDAQGDVSPDIDAQRLGQGSQANYLARLAVARRAYLEINPGDSVFLDVSRTNAILARLIAEGDKKVIVTTNMIDILRTLSNLPHVTALGTGGYLNVQLNGFVGSATVSLLEPLLFAKAFIGASGVDLDRAAVTSNNIDSGSVKERVIHNASYKFLLADEAKFKLRGAYRFASLSDFSAVITDAQDPEVLRKLQMLAIPTLRALPPLQ